jgi:hypothetical protein
VQVQAGERLIGRLSVTSWSPPGLQLHLYGVYEVGVPGGVPTAAFNPAVTPSSAKRVATLYVAYSAGTHQYRLDCQLRSDGATAGTTDYRLTAQDNTDVQVSTQPQGPVTVSFRIAVDSPDAGRRYWVLGNDSGQSWTFFGCDVYELSA